MIQPILKSRQSSKTTGVVQDLAATAKEKFVVGSSKEMENVAKESWADKVEEKERQPLKHDSMSQNVHPDLRPNIWILCKDEHMANSLMVNGRSWHLGFVHACTAFILRWGLWNDILSLHLGDICLMGDFNVVLGLVNAHVVLLVRPGLLRIHLVHQTTFFGLHSSPIGSRSCSQTFLDLWHYLDVTVLARYSSDHHPLLAMTKDTSVSTGPRPFQFLSIWTLQGSFDDITRGC
ncbi:hypothetical protein ACS0TY_003600 [Phlomoides rotata]